jgi:D-alanyl-lipoteichoic acid acyltransferase DltB (MBOAT superfamily)
MSTVEQVLGEKAVLVLVLFLSLLLLDPLVPASLTVLPFVIIGVAGAWLLSKKRSLSRALILLSTVAVLVLFASTRLLPIPVVQAERVPIGLLFLIFVLILYSYCAGQILLILLRAKEVTHHLIVWAVNLYIILGIFWAHLYTVLDWIQPEAFSLNVQQKDSASHFVYFSFVTLASLGYGDITPKTQIAQRLAIVEVIMGQFYVAIVVAYLVSVFIGRKIRGVDGGSNHRDDQHD